MCFINVKGPSLQRLLGMSLSARCALSQRVCCPSCRRRLLHCISCCASAEAGEQAPRVLRKVCEVEAVPVPLCQRAANHVEEVHSVLQWRHQVVDKITSINDAFQSADDGPTAAELQAFREHEQQQWLPCTWQQLDSEIRTATRRSKDTSQWQVQLRAPVRHLQQLWELRLKERVPFQYLIHTAHWRDLILSVGPGILVPRPETELMIDLAAEAMAANPALAAAPWADLGTGSGAIAIATAKLLLQQQQQQQTEKQIKPVVCAVDLSPTAVAYATANAASCGVQQIVNILQGSWFEPLEGLAGRLGGVLSNPPYLPRVQMAGLQAEVGVHEPWSALDGGPEEGLDSLQWNITAWHHIADTPQVICEEAGDMLMPGGFIALETAGEDQAMLVKQLLEKQQRQNVHAFVNAKVQVDCFGVPRFVTATRRM